MGILTHKTNARLHGHHHAEAFCWMTYGTKPGPNFVRLRIWNSRDGVTPFITISKEYGLELQHVNYEEDRYDPDYKPVKGDLIWRSYTEEEAQEAGRKYYAMMLEYQADVKDMPVEEIIVKYYYDRREQLNEIVTAGEQAAIDAYIERLFKTREPRLCLVEEDWK